MKKETIYQTSRYEAYVRHTESKTIVVSFAERKEPKPASFSGESMLEKTGLSYCCIRSLENDWYVHSEFENCLDSVELETSKYENVILYGFSMGSYGALRSARKLGAKKIILMAPISNIHPEFDKRWISDYRHLIEKHNEKSLNPNIDRGMSVFAVYDKKGPDVSHVKNISHLTNVKSLMVDRSGHMVFQMLNSSGILGKVARGLMQENADVESLQGLINKSKKNSSLYISELSKSLGKHKKLKINLLNYAVSKFPDDSTIKLDLAGANAELGNFSEAAKIIRSVVRDTGQPMSVPVIRALVSYAEYGGCDADISDLVSVYESSRGRSREIQLLYSRYLRHVKRYNDAFIAHESFMRGGPFSSQGFFERGLIFEDLGLPYMAKKCYREALVEDNNFSRARTRLKQLEV